LKNSLLKKKEDEAEDFDEDGETHKLNVNRINGLITSYDN